MNNQPFRCIAKPRVLLPNKDIDLNKWAVIACDQFTSPNENYWQKVEKYVGDAPSTLKLIFPEYYLADKENINSRIQKIQTEMKKYLSEGVLVDPLGKDYFVYTRRKLSNGKVRQGLVALMDLEEYSYKKGEKTAIRPTEGIVEERLPIRMEIRKGAPLEFPHILMLVDDPERKLIEPLGVALEKHTKLFDFDLMMDGGHAEGYAVTSMELEKKIVEVMEGFADRQLFQKKYGLSSPENPLVVAVGDGNHSLASAKAVWEEVKQRLITEGKSWENNPARYAMAEIINVHDEALVFEPIHRVLFDVGEMEPFMEVMNKYFGDKGSMCNVRELETKEEMSETMMDKKGSKNSQMFGVSYIKNEELKYLVVEVTPPVHSLVVGALQMFIDDYISLHSEVKVDYLHGEEGVIRDSSIVGNVGFFLPGMNKGDLFNSVIQDGVTPRKTFSMGEADTKAYYIMGHKITE